MKLYFYLFLLVFSSCASQERFLKNDNICEFDNPFLKIKEEEKEFNKKEYDSILNIQPIYTIDTKDLVTTISKYRIKKKNLKSKFSKFIAYYPSGNIKYYYNYIENVNSYRLKIGEQVFYNENGEIAKTINHERNYTICWAEAIEILKKIARKYIKKNTIVDFMISRSELNEKPKWTISMIGENGEEYTDHYEIDGVTGELIRKYKIIRVYEE
ncbi:hypothetical protein [Aquimarina sp. I32.4]|uniref:hypothetical protein n=1 Tax=Aquimarina sp. I32.4 TaxID=2053903 RepID=UPI000CDF10C0|nr:hypothetical protein [Aquimarina sp. I32.4]